MNRRVRKQVFVYASGWPQNPDEDWRFVYDQWNVVLVLDGTASNTTERKHTWGLDLSGQSGAASVPGIHGAGGIGGLLAVEETATEGSPEYWFFYDANGNVGQIVNNAAGYTVAAHYEYDPYGHVITAVDADSSGYVTNNPIRFSTKWFDAETGLGYWGYRYYSPKLGRWMSRDPIEEDGGLNLYAFVHSSPVNDVDVLGKALFPTSCPPAEIAWCRNFCTSRGMRYKYCIVSGIWPFRVLSCRCSQPCTVVGYNTGVIHKKTCLPWWECTATCPNGYSWEWKQLGGCPKSAWS
jgi:RHS repeat-associated protein